MSELLGEVRDEIIEVHRFFVDWYNGTAAVDTLDSWFAPRMDPDFVIIAPDGGQTNHTKLMAHFRQSHGQSPGFQITIRDVTVRHQLDRHVLATYCERQSDTARQDQPNSARISTVLLARAEPFRWLHVHETWLSPE